MCLKANVRFALGLAMISLSACSEEFSPVPEQVRPIRAFTIADVASGKVRKFSAVINASDSSSLSFQIGGNVDEVRVSQGDQVTKGQVLAVLDKIPFQLNVQAAEADLVVARADQAQKKADFDRQKTLYEQGWVARVRFDNAQRYYSSSVGRVDYAVARLNLAQRDLRNTTLVAPFDGFISVRSIDPFVEVRAGQILFRIDAEGGFEAAFGVPENTISQVVAGMQATVKFPQIGEPVDALITEVGSAAGIGNAFPVKATLIEPPSIVRPGMTAEVTLLLSEGAMESGYLVPLSAVKPSDTSGEGFVFIYEPKFSTVRRTLVKYAHPLIGNMVGVTVVKSGDIVATAGVNFLVDGQKVKLLEPAVGS
ncbi:MAG: efflux RND transporter periplasmic adaptor subunit [Hyphomicrobiaceae bacterium]